MIRRTLLLFGAASLLAGTFVSSAVEAASAATTAAVLSPDEQAAIIADSQGPFVNFAGKLPGTNAYIGVATRGGVVEAYICDGGKIAVWLKGSVSGSKMSGSNTAGNASLSATLGKSGLVGKLTLKGRSIDLRIARVSYPSGLWRAYDVVGEKVVKAGWVLLPDGTQRGAKLVNGTVGSVDSLIPTGGGADIGQDGILDSADPVAFKKTVTKKDAPPKSTCAKLETEYDRLRAIADDPNRSAGDRTEAGNTAHDIYLKGMGHSCGWSPSPSGPGNAS